MTKWKQLTNFTCGLIAGTPIAGLILSKKNYKDYWDRPNGCCSQCGAPLNEYMVGGYKLHDGTFAVSAACNKSTGKEIIRAYNEYLERQGK